MIDFQRQAEATTITALSTLDMLNVCEFVFGEISAVACYASATIVVLYANFVSIVGSIGAGLESVERALRSSIGANLRAVLPVILSTELIHFFAIGKVVIAPHLTSSGDVPLIIFSLLGEYLIFVGVIMLTLLPDDRISICFSVGTLLCQRFFVVGVMIRAMANFAVGRDSILALLVRAKVFEGLFFAALCAALHRGICGIIHAIHTLLRGVSHAQGVSAPLCFSLPHYTTLGGNDG